MQNKKTTKKELMEELEEARKRISELESRVNQEGMEKELLRIAKDKAEGASKLKDKFVSLISHDLKSPLATLVGFLRLIRDFEDRGDPFPMQKTKDMMDSAIQTGEKMATLIQELLSISRLKTGKVVPRLSFIDAQFLASSVVDEFAPLAEKKGINLNNGITSRARIYADQILLSEVLKNLISNSIKFCDKGNEITISLPYGKPSTITVSDNGVGIKSERLSDIFKYEVHTSTPGTAGETGSGLGLPMSKDIMLAHGGDLIVESEPGKGSVFYAFLPDVKPVILIVDKDAKARELIGLCIQNLDVRTMEAENGKVALELMKQIYPHLVITDLVLPEMDGFDLIDYLKKEPTLAQVPVIVVTSDSDMKTKDKAFAIGADDFVAKPFTLEDLNPRVKRFVG